VPTRAPSPSPSRLRDRHGCGAGVLASPSVSRSFFSISLARSGLSRRNARAFSVPAPGGARRTRTTTRTCPRSGGYSEVEQVRLTRDPLAVEDVELGAPERRATLFLTTRRRVRLPVVSSPSLIAPTRRMSRRIDA